MHSDPEQEGHVKPVGACQRRAQVCRLFQFKLATLFVASVVVALLVSFVLRSDVIPITERWHVTLDVTDEMSISDYARTLDRLDVELGSSRGKEIEYASQFTLNANAHTRRGKTSEERRYRFTHKSETPMYRLDVALLGRAGIARNGRRVQQFYPETLVNELVRLELEFAHDHGAGRHQIEKTVFEIRCFGRGHEFVVVDQDYR